MQFIPARVVFNDKETAFLKSYIQQWDEDGKKRKAIDAAESFEVCTVKEDDEDVRGFRVDYQDAEGKDDVSYVSFQGLEAHIVNTVTADDTEEV